MKQPHIQLDESLNVRYAILPGDPRRAERICLLYTSPSPRD